MCRSTVMYSPGAKPLQKMWSCWISCAKAQSGDAEHLQCCWSEQCNNFGYRDFRAILSSSDFYSLFWCAKVMSVLGCWCWLPMSVLSGPPIQIQFSIWIKFSCTFVIVTGASQSVNYCHPNTCNSGSFGAFWLAQTHSCNCTVVLHFNHQGFWTSILAIVKQILDCTHGLDFCSAVCSSDGKCSPELSFKN